MLRAFQPLLLFPERTQDARSVRQQVVHHSPGTLQRHLGPGFCVVLIHE